MECRKTLRALIVDDSSAFCAMLKEHLYHFGISRIDYCQEGEQALELVLAATKSYDAIFIDLQLQGMDGFELLQRLHIAQYNGAIIIVSVLDQNMIELTLQLIEKYSLRLLGSLEKPIDKQAVARIVTRLINMAPLDIADEPRPKKHELLDALRQNQLQTYFQPIISSNNNEIYALECLTRLNIPAYGQLHPDFFLPLIEHYDLLEPFLQNVFAVAAPAFHGLLDEFDKPIKLAINLSTFELYREKLHIELAEFLFRYRLNQDQVYFEISDHAELGHKTQQNKLKALSTQGLRLSLDNYTALYSKVDHIQNMPFTEIKLDGELVAGLHGDKMLSAAVKAIRARSRKFKIPLVAQGIDDPEDLLLLNSLGVDRYQGYLFCRPKPADILLRWMTHWQAENKEALQSEFNILDK